jgi:hypothetical protein
MALETTMLHPQVSLLPSLPLLHKVVNFEKRYWMLIIGFIPLRTEIYFCHQNQNAKNIGNFTTLLKPHNIGTDLKGIETSFQIIPLFSKSFHFWVNYITFWNFVKIPSVLEELCCDYLYPAWLLFQYLTCNSTWPSMKMCGFAWTNEYPADFPGIILQIHSYPNVQNFHLYLHKILKSRNPLIKGLTT